MKIKAVIFLLIALTSLASSLAMASSVKPLINCCHMEKSGKSCSKPVKEKKPDCDRDHCNPFLSCSITAIVISGTLRIKLPQLTVKQQLIELETENLSEFPSKHWHPPKDDVESLVN